MSSSRMSTKEGRDSIKLPTSTSSKDDMDCAWSDAESVSIDSERDNETSLDYWFGRMYFECVVAEHLLHHLNSVQSVMSVDVL